MLIAAAGEAGRQPDFVLAFLPPEENLRDVLAAMTLVWPDALRFGCEAVTQVADGEITRQGTLQLFITRGSRSSPALMARRRPCGGSRAWPGASSPRTAPCC